MEDNLTAALIMSFSVIVFIIALSITMYMFSEVTSTSEILVANADTTKYYDNIQLLSNDSMQSDSAIREGKERIVDSNTVIPTLYRYYKENFCVKIYDDTEDKYGISKLTTNDPNSNINTGKEPARLVHIFDLALENEVFKAKSYNKSLNPSASDSEKSEDKKNKVLKDLYCSVPSEIDNNNWMKYKLNDRLCMYGAVWGSDNKYIKQRVDFFVNGTSGYINGSYVDFEGNPLAISLVASTNGVPNYYFTEKFVSYTYTGESIETEEGDTLVTGMKPKDKIVIIYTIYDNRYKDKENNIVPVINN